MVCISHKPSFEVVYDVNKPDVLILDTICDKDSGWSVRINVNIYRDYCFIIPTNFEVKFRFEKFIMINDPNDETSVGVFGIKFWIQKERHPPLAMIRWNEIFTCKITWKVRSKRTLEFGTILSGQSQFRALRQPNSNFEKVKFGLEE